MYVKYHMVSSLHVPTQQFVDELCLVTVFHLQIHHQVDLHPCDLKIKVKIILIKKKDKNKINIFKLKIFLKR